MPPKAFSTLISPSFLSAWALTFFSSSRFAGRTFSKVSFNVGSEDEE